VAATLALIAVLAFWGVRDFEHRRAVSALEARLYEGADPIRVSAYPVWINPFRWYGVVETQNFFASVEVDSAAPDVDPGGRMRIRYKPEETPATLAAKKSYLGRVYLDWAQYPMTETEDLGQGYLIRFYDLRYDYPGRTGRRPLGATVELDRNLEVVAETFGFRGRRTSPGRASSGGSR
jgi:inner membrane protein